MSARLVDLARSRLARLRPEVSDALALVAVGAPIPYEVLASALPVDTLDELTTTNLAQIATVGPTTVVRPAHPLYGEVLIAGLGGQRLRGIHSALVAAAATAPEAIDPLRVAVWQQRAGVDPDPMIALNGVQAALARHDGALAASLLDPVVDRIDPSMASLLTGASLVQQGRFEEAESAFAKAPPHSDSIHTHSAVEIASARAFNMAFGLRRPADAGAMLAALADEVDDPVERGRLDSERGVIAGIDGDFTLALAAATRTVANPAARGPALASAYVSLTLTESMLARCTDIEEHSWAGVAVAADCASALPLARAQILTMLTIGLVSSGEIDRARALAEAEVADDPQLTLGLWEMTLGMVLCQEGRLDDAAEETRRALGRSELTGLLDLRGMASGLLAAIEGQTGRADGWAQLDELRERHGDPRNAIWLDRGRAWTRAASGDLHGAVEIVVDGGRQALDNDHIAWGVLELHDAVRMSTHATVDPTVVDDLRGAVATTEGAALLDTVVRHGTALAGSDPEQLMSVAVAFAAAGSAIFAAEAAAHAASIHAARSETSAASRATTLSAAWHSQCRSARTPALLGRPDLGLSSRELEIALDAARGDTSADIAQSRFISVRTVDNHLGSAYRTLEASGRAELAEVLAPVLRFSLDHTDDE